MAVSIMVNRPGTASVAATHRSLLCLLLVCVATAFTGTGCRSTTSGGSGGFASVEIRGNTPGQIRDMIRRVFQEEGYIGVVVNSADLTFEKQGSTLDSVAYGGLLDTIWVRVETTVVPAGDMTYRLQCQVRYFQGRGMLAEEVKHAHIRNAPYQKMLDEVARRVGGK